MTYQADLYLDGLEFADLCEFTTRHFKANILRFTEDVIVYMELTSKKAYLVRIESTNGIWSWNSKSYYDDGPYIVFRDNLERVLNRTRWN